MDDLDRLFFELVESLRRERPAALADPITVGELHERVIPYRLIRDSVGFRSNDDYELAFCRLAAGERSYLLGDRVMQQELREALSDVLPDIHCYRAYKDEQVWLNPAAIPPPGDTRYAPPEMREATAQPATAEEPDAVAEVAVEVRPDEEEAAERLDPADFSRFSEDDTHPSQELVSGTPGDAEASELSADGGELETCPTCGDRPPEGSAFCPFCGTRLRPALCSDCGSALEPRWRFCPACGRRRTPGEGSA